MAFVIMVLTAIYLILNIKELGGGVGYQYLGLGMVIGLLLLILSARWCVITRVKTSQLLLACFLAYFAANVVFDTTDLGRLHAVTTGTKSGVIFGLALGYLLSFVISDIYLCIKKHPWIIGYVSFFIILYLMLVLYLAVNVFEGHLANVGRELFLIEGQRGVYQRPAAFIFIQFMLSNALIALLYVFMQQINTLVFTFALVLDTLIGIVFILLAQLIGSNAGLGAVAGFYVMLLTFLYVARAPGLKEGSSEIGIRPVVFGWIGRRILIGAGGVVSVIALAIIYLFQYADLDASLFRITSYGSGESSSVNSRVDIFRNNFLEQLSYDPIFGNTQVEFHTTGPGTYVHSLLAILTHLGIIGFVLFGLFVFQIYREITQRKTVYNALHTDRVYTLFRLFAMGTVLLFALLTAFYTWLPLWFAIGFFGIGLSTPSKVKS